MPPLTVSIRMVSGACNGDCTYCGQRAARGDDTHRRMDSVILEGFIPELTSYLADVGHGTLIWSGVEPTLAGLGFMEWAAELQDRLGRPDVHLRNVLVTNGLLLDGPWADFLAARRFLVRLSMDGPAPLHDRARRDAWGNPCFQRVRRSLSLLQAAGVDVAVTCVIGPHNVERGSDLVSFFRDAGVSYLDFVPALDHETSAPTGPVRYLVSPEAFGGFLVDAFDAWWLRGRPDLSVRAFDHLVQAQVGDDATPCAHAERCDGPLVLDVDGGLYPCEHYVHPGWRLGSVLETPLRDLVEGVERTAFRGQKRPLPDACGACPWSGLCNGGCYRNRLLAWDGSDRPDVFCEGYRRLWSYVDAHLGLAS